MITRLLTLPCMALFLLPFTLDAQYDVFVSDAQDFDVAPWQILKFDANGENGEIFINTHLAWPQDLVFPEGTGTVLISNLNNGRISRFDATTGDFIDEFATGIGGPTRMKIGPDGLLYVLQWQGNGRVLRYNLDGMLVDQFTDTAVPTSIGFDWDSAGNLYVSSYGTKIVRKFNSSGEDMGLFITGLAGPTNIWFTDNGDLMVMDYNAGNVKRYNSEGMLLGTAISGLPQGEGVAFLPDGTMLLGSGGLHSVRHYTADGSFLGNFIAPGTLDLKTPNAVILHDSGTSALETTPKAQEMILVSPTVGSVFEARFADSDSLIITIHNAEGKFCGRMYLGQGESWSPSTLPNGVYVLTAEMRDSALARQLIVVQR